MFYISYMPQYIALHLHFFCTSCHESTTFHKIVLVLLRFWYINSAINPFVYAWRVPKYRQAFSDCWKMCLGKFRVTPYQAPLSSQNQTSRERHGGIAQSPEQIRESAHNVQPQEDSFETHLWDGTKDGIIRLLQTSSYCSCVPLFSAVFER